MIAEKLRKAVLQAAIQGKLSQQLPEDGDARDLLKEIQQEKARLVKEGKFKKEKPLLPITEDEIPFDIPENWVWVRLQEITSVLGDGIHGTPKYSDVGGYYFINGSNLHEGSIIVNGQTKKVDIDEYEKHKKPLTEKTVFVSINGSIGRVAFFKGEKVILGKSVCYFNLMGSIEKKFIKILINGSYFLDYAFNKATGSTIKNVPLSAMRSILVPLPPIREQERLVAFVDHMLQEIIMIEADESKLEALQKAFPQQLKNAILQAAIQGKLTEQLPEDGDARDLLKQIQQEKASLVKTGKLKKENPLPPITEDELPFDTPDNWAWVRLADCCDINTGNSIPKHTKEHKYSIKIDGFPYIATKDVSFDNSIDYKNGVYIPFGEPNFKVAPKNSILLCIEGGSAGRKIGIIDQDVCFGNKLCKFEPITILPKLIFYYLQSSVFQSLFVSEMTGIIGGVGVNRIKNLPIPIPPIDEQKRIVDRMDKLLPLCEKLE